MGVLGIVALRAALAGCGSTRQETASRLGQQYIGQNVDARRWIRTAGDNDDQRADNQEEKIAICGHQ
jgi:hypothetical protein